MSLFPTTQWGAVVAAGRGGRGRDPCALEALCAAYWSPLYVRARSLGHGADAARDLTQGFFVYLLERDLLDVADPGRGSFRAFLKAAFDHYAANERRKERAQKRGAGGVPLPLDFDLAETRVARAGNGAAADPEAAFERQWAHALLSRALARLEAEMAAASNGDRFRRLSPLLTGADGGAAYARLGIELGLSESAVKVAVHRMRKRFGALLRDEVADTVQDRDRIDAELRHVLAVLGG